MKNIIKNTNKKGFTIVELVIVIAVIAILAGVLIPTFSSIITKANESAALQEATNAYKEAYAEAIADGKITTITVDGETTTIEYNETVEKGEFTFVFTSTNGSIDTISVEVNEPDDFGYTVTVSNGVVKVQKNQ